MLRLRKYLKPYLALAFTAIGLLFVTNICDLKLPDIMSNIVNVGIQQSGIEHASPSEVKADTFVFMQALMNEEEKQALNDAYTLENDHYVLKEISDEQREVLDQHFSLATWTFINAMKEMGNGATMPEMGSEGIGEINLDQLVQLTPLLQMMDLSQAREQALQQDETTRLGTGVVFAKMMIEQAGLDTGKIQRDYILLQGGKMLLIALFGVIGTIAVGYLSSKTANGLARDLRHEVFKKVETFSNAEFDNFSTSSLITRTTNDVTQVSMLVLMGLRIIISAPIMGIGALIMIFERNTSMVWILGLAIVAVSCLILFMFLVAMPKFTLIQKLVDRLNLVSRENLSGLMVIRAFQGQEFEKQRFEKANHDLTSTHLFVNRVMAFMMPFMTIVMNGVMLLIIWVGAHQIADATMQVGDMMAFMQYAMQVIMSFVMISMMFIMVPRAAVSANRIADVLEVEATIRDPQVAKPFDESLKGVVEFKHVSFNYGDAQENVLDDISFVAKPGETTAFIGSTGSGKSTLINLIPRFYDVTSGEILVNGVNVKDVSLHDLHEQIGYVAQKGLLFSGTIEENIKYGKDRLSLDEVKEVAKVAQADDFISLKEEGYNFEIAQGGTNVSGGQKQRLSIARALAMDAPIYIFDDSFSALDFKTDATLRAALRQHTANATLLIVAQRVSSIMNAEQIIVLDEGKVVGKGTHEELLKNCPTYYEIASSQLSKEEL